MIIQHSYDEQLTSSHKETHELEKNCAMLQGNIAFICLIYMQYIIIYVCALLLKRLSAQSAVYTRLYTQVPTDLELEITCRLVLCYDSSFKIWTALSIDNKLLLS